MKIPTIPKLVFGLALVFALLGGASMTADAACLSGCLFPCTGNCAAVAAQPAGATCQGAYYYGPTVPKYIGLAGF